MKCYICFIVIISVLIQNISTECQNICLLNGKVVKSSILTSNYCICCSENIDINTGTEQIAHYVEIATKCSNKISAIVTDDETTKEYCNSFKETLKLENLLNECSLSSYKAKHMGNDCTNAIREPQTKITSTLDKFDLVEIGKKSNMKLYSTVDKLSYISCSKNSSKDGQGYIILSTIEHDNIHHLSHLEGILGMSGIDNEKADISKCVKGNNIHYSFSELEKHASIILECKDSVFKFHIVPDKKNKINVRGDILQQTPPTIIKSAKIKSLNNELVKNLLNSYKNATFDLFVLNCVAFTDDLWDMLTETKYELFPEIQQKLLYLKNDNNKFNTFLTNKEALKASSYTRKNFMKSNTFTANKETLKARILSNQIHGHKKIIKNDKKIN